MPDRRTEGDHERVVGDKAGTFRRFELLSLLENFGVVAQDEYGT